MSETRKQMSPKERVDRLAAIGYCLSFNKFSVLSRKKHKFRTSPSQSGGPVCYFDSTDELERHIRGVEKIRHWQDQTIHPRGLAEMKVDL